MIKKINHDRAMDLKINDLIISSIVLVACPESDPDLIAGYFIYSHNCAHYIYVKESFRKNGVANELFKESGLQAKGLLISHISKDILNINSIKDLSFELNPFT